MRPIKIGFTRTTRLSASAGQSAVDLLDGEGSQWRLIVTEMAPSR
jgi:hypothetical protein